MSDMCDKADIKLVAAFIGLVEYGVAKDLPCVADGLSRIKSARQKELDMYAKIRSAQEPAMRKTLKKSLSTRLRLPLLIVRQEVCRMLWPIRPTPRWH